MGTEEITGRESNFEDKMQIFKPRRVDVIRKIKERYRMKDLQYISSKRHLK